MYPVLIFLLMLILPVGSIILDHSFGGSNTGLIHLVGKWFVFWSVGVRLTLAGLRQFFQPGFTAQEIFRVKGDDALPVVRELGVSNAAMGIVGLASLLRPDFVLPVAIAAFIFYGVAGIRHTREPNRSQNETLAMASDLFVGAILAVFVVGTVFA